MTETELLFTEILGCDRATLHLNKWRSLGAGVGGRIASAFTRRVAGEPIQYILGKTEFMGLEFMVNPAVLIPRPETELLIEKAISLVHSPCQPINPSGRGFISHCVKILDIGTGSGCIAISLAKLLENCHIDAVDISREALEVAESNALLHNVEINFIQGDLFPYELRTKNYELIVSNPPYIPSAGIERLQPEIQYEPRIALDGGGDGLAFYRRIIGEASGFLKENGFLLMEAGFGQAAAVCQIFRASNSFKVIEIVKDYGGIERVIVAQRIVTTTTE